MIVSDVSSIFLLFLLKLTSLASAPRGTYPRKCFLFGSNLNSNFFSSGKLKKFLASSRVLSTNSVETE